MEDTAVEEVVELEAMEDMVAEEVVEWEAMEGTVVEEVVESDEAEAIWKKNLGGSIKRLISWKFQPKTNWY